MKHMARLGAGGRLVIPAKMRKALDVKAGDELVISLDGNALRIASVSEAVRRAQDLVGRYLGAERSLAEELINERIREARDE